MDIQQSNLLGAYTAISIFTFSIMVFLFRMTNQKQLEYLSGLLFIASVIPLFYLVLTSARMNRPRLYLIQVMLMILFIIVELLVDYILNIDFRNIRWMLISYVTLFFSATGGMIGVAANAGKPWAVVSIVLYLTMAALAFLSRAATGI
mgnify:CR=1 FL=1